ncbi:MAG: ABC-type transport auxiliary lipoprotein family protein [Betaproteobacteria bacterium]
MKKLTILLAVCLLSACVSGRRGAETNADVYDLGPDSGVRHAVTQTGIALEVRMPLWLVSLGIQYRLLYSGESKLREYGYARWAGMPDDLVEQRLGQELGLATVRDGVSVPCLLSIDIDQFGQNFGSASDSRGVIVGKARLLDNRRALIASRQIKIEHPAPTANAQGGVRALTAATDTLADELAQWLDQLAKSRKLECTANP